MMKIDFNDNAKVQLMDFRAGYATMPQSIVFDTYQEDSIFGEKRNAVMLEYTVFAGEEGSYPSEEVVSVNLPDQLLLDSEKEFFLDEDCISSDMLEYLVEHEYIQNTGRRGESGFKTYPVYEILAKKDKSNTENLETTGNVFEVNDAYNSLSTHMDRDDLILLAIQYAERLSDESLSDSEEKHYQEILEKLHDNKLDFKEVSEMLESVQVYVTIGEDKPVNDPDFEKIFSGPNE
ncbi:DUF4313 domain-containing protein [Ligilactobacillus equi]|nr:DUF4313 domain-containing protein [Ligilactobacillus equi]